MDDREVPIRDAGWCDAEIAAGRPIALECLHLARPLRAARHAFITGCDIDTDFPATKDVNTAYGLFDGPMSKVVVRECTINLAKGNLRGVPNIERRVAGVSGVSDKWHLITCACGTVFGACPGLNGTLPAQCMSCIVNGAPMPTPAKIAADYGELDAAYAHTMAEAGLVVSKADKPCAHLATAAATGVCLHCGAETRRELRPPPEHDGKPLHWVRQEATSGGRTLACNPVLARWMQIDSGSSADSWLWQFVCTPDDITACHHPESLAALGYRYLGPAEWEAHGDHAALKVAGNALDEYAARIATLEAEAATSRRLLMNYRALAKRNAELEAEVARLNGMLSGKLSISCADRS